MVSDAGERWLGSGPVDLLDERRSIKAGEEARIAVRPMQPSAWQEVQPGDALHLRERVGQTLGVAIVAECVGVPHDAPLRLDAIRLRPGAALLERRDNPWGPARWLRRFLR